MPQEPRQFTSLTQPIPRGDAFVPQSVDIAPEGFTLVNQGRIFTPFWNDSVVAKPSARGGANWPPSSYDPETNYYYVCATDAQNLFRCPEFIQRRRGRSKASDRGSKLFGKRFWRHAPGRYRDFCRLGHEDEPPGLAATMEGALLQWFGD